MRKLRLKVYGLRLEDKTRTVLLSLVFCFSFVTLPAYAQEAGKESDPANQEAVVKADEPVAKEDTNVPTVSDVKLSTVSDNKDAPAGAGMPVEGIIVNGDRVEFSTEEKEITATGNVSVIYKGAKLTCDKLVVNSQTKVGEAIGNARLEDPKGIIEGTKIIYDFGAKTGTIIDTQFRANPYFGTGETTEKVSDAEFVVRRGILTTCNFDHPHWRIKSKKIDMFPGDKVQTRDNVFFIGPFPALYMPQLSRSLKDPLMQVQLMPGTSKEWGTYMLTAWRYNLTEDVAGRIYADYRSSLGVAEGFGVNYNTQQFGKGDFKYYYTQERNKTKQFEALPKDAARVFQRYLIRLRHKWVIDTQTNLTAEYWKITDSKRSLYGPTYNFIKDYWYREYETDTQPLSYVSAHRSFTYGSVDFLMQPRVNSWYNAGFVEKLPEIQYTLPSFHIGETPFYFDQSSLAGNYNMKNTNTDIRDSGTPDRHMNRLNTNNKLSMPVKVAFIKLTPFVNHQGTYYQEGDPSAGAKNLFRTIFSSGAEASTKFFRIFKIKSNFLGLDINDVRHIITPTINYTYQHTPTIRASKLTQIDGVDSITNPSNSSTLQLSNILQTKRNDVTVDFFDFLISAPYSFKSGGGSGVKSSKLGDITLKLKFLPWSNVALYSDSTFSRAHDETYNKFVNVNYELSYDMGNERSVGFGQRYQRKGSNEFTLNFNWRINPKWKFTVYERYAAGSCNPALLLGRGLREQEYVLSRDMHCWTMEATYNVTRDKGESIFIAFKLKAFPELGFNFNQAYHQPRAGGGNEEALARRN